MQIQLGASTHVGQVRTVNEDSVLAEHHLVVVADGMGGHARGDLASACAVAEFRPLARKEYLTPADVEHAIEAANTRILDEVRHAPELDGMGTTLTGVALVQYAGEPHWLVFNVGDSRVYRVTDAGADQLTVDHSEVSELIALGRLTREAAGSHPLRHVITRSLGTTPPPVPDVWVFPASPGGDTFVACSDGLTNELTETEIAEIVNAVAGPARRRRRIGRRRRDGRRPGQRHSRGRSDDRGERLRRRGGDGPARRSRMTAFESHYSPGRWVAVSAGTGWLLVDLRLTDERLANAWSRLRAGATADEVLDVLLSDGLQSLPGFALVTLEQDALRIVVRGAAAVVADGRLVETSNATWVDETVPRPVATVRLYVKNDEPGEVTLPMSAGISQAGQVVLHDTNAQDTDSQSPSPEPDPASEPEPGPEPVPEPGPSPRRSPRPNSNRTPNRSRSPRRSPSPSPSRSPTRNRPSSRTSTTLLAGSTTPTSSRARSRAAPSSTGWSQGTTRSARTLPRSPPRDRSTTPPPSPSRTTPRSGQGLPRTRCSSGRPPDRERAVPEPDVPTCRLAAGVDRPAALGGRPRNRPVRSGTALGSTPDTPTCRRAELDARPTGDPRGACCSPGD